MGLASSLDIPHQHDNGFRAEAWDLPGNPELDFRFSRKTTYKIDQKMSVRKLIVDDADPAMVYSGSWTTGTTRSATTNEYNVTYHLPGAQGDSVLFTFEGTGVDVYATLNSPATIGTLGPLFTIDDGTPVRFNETGDIHTASPTNPASHVLVMRFYSLSQGQHTLNITFDRFALTRPFFYFDFVVVTTNDMNASGYVIVDDKDPSISYTGDWRQSPQNTTDYERSMMYTPAGINDLSASFTFTGTEVTVFGAMPGIYPYTLNVGFTIDGVEQSARNIDTANIDVMRHSRFLLTTGLEAKEHTLVITQRSTDVMFYLDYITYKASTVEQNADPGSTPSAQTTSTSQTGSRSRSTSPSSSGTQVTSGPRDASTPQKKTDTGLIVGGVIGGVALIAIALIVLFLLRRKRQPREKRADQAPRMKDAHGVTPYTMKKAPGRGGRSGVEKTTYGGHPSHSRSASTPEGVSSGGMVNAHGGNPNGRVSSGYGVVPGQDRTASPHYPWLGGNNLANTSQQQVYYHPRSSSLDFSRDPNFRAAGPSGVAQPGQGFMPRHSSLDASGARPRAVEKASYPRATNTNEPPPYVDN
ncbi:hypothetical protein CPB86DRAFT_860151 [Serendipita vermifera]|nr:hypothetical protein CPB86DRAFT_860151 [Serendipita vermifera]